MVLGWSEWTVPRVERAGWFSIGDRAFERAYGDPTHAIHLHDYAGQVRLGAKTHELQPGDLTITVAGCESAYALPRPGKHLCVHFAPGPRGRIDLPPVARLGPRVAFVRAHLERIVTEHAAAGLGAGSAARSGVTLLGLMLDLWDLQERPRGRMVASDRGVEDVARFLAEHPESRDSVAELAARAALSPGYLAARFRARFGCTLARYRLDRRIASAQRLLETTDRPLKAIASELGFSDPHHFNKQFRRVVGQSPSGYRSRTRRSAS